MGKLDGRVGLVTGAGRGIGRAVALALAAEGTRVVVTSRSEAELAQVVEVIGSASGEAMACAGDITDDDFVARLFRRVREAYGRVDILVNNAGMAPFGPAQELPADDLRRCLELNVVAPFVCMQHAIRLMEDTTGTGKIINIGSVRSHWTEAGDAGAYNASKEGLRALSESVARQLHGTGSKIAVSMVCPGVVDTTLTNPTSDARPDWLRAETVADAVLHAVTAPDDVNVFDIVLFPMAQRPW